jgi:hypothetical protein
MRVCAVDFHDEREAEQSLAAIPLREWERLHVVVVTLRPIRSGLDRLEGEHGGEHTSRLGDRAIDVRVEVAAARHLAREQLVALREQLGEDANETLDALGVLGGEEVRVGEQRAEPFGVDAASREVAKLLGDDLRITVRAGAVCGEVAGHLVVCGRDGGAESRAMLGERFERAGGAGVRWHTCRAPR